MPARDTSIEAYGVQVEVVRAMSTGERMAQVMELSESMWAVTADGIRRRHPDYDSSEVEWASRRLRLGDELFRAAWPEAPRLEP